MTDAWFGLEIPRGLAFLSMLSLLAIPAAQGRWKSAVTVLWLAIIAIAAPILAGAARALAKIPQVC